MSVRFTRKTRGRTPAASFEKAHAAAHFTDSRAVGDDWLNWATTATLEGLTLLPDEWTTGTKADELRAKHPRPWRFVMENHKVIAAAGIRCEYRSKLYREIGSERYCVFLDSDFWNLIVDAGKGVRGAREYHALLMGLLEETKRQVDAAEAPPEAPEEAPEAPPAPRQKAEAPVAEAGPPPVPKTPPAPATPVPAVRKSGGGGSPRAPEQASLF
jgi:hypothetical protein